MSITLQVTEQGAVVRLEGEIDIECSDELKGALVEGLATRSVLRAEVSGLTGLDLAAIQLLWAAVRSAENTAKSFIVAGALPERVRDMVRDAGFAEFPPSSGPAANSDTGASSMQPNLTARRG